MPVRQLLLEETKQFSLLSRGLQPYPFQKDLNLSLGQSPPPFKMCSFLMYSPRMPAYCLEFCNYNFILRLSFSSYHVICIA